jgi:rhamnosyltransferase subunit B
VPESASETQPAKATACVALAFPKLNGLKILFSTFGSLGDIHPYLALALEAKARGHSPIIATSAHYGEKIEALGIEFRAVAPDLPPETEVAPLIKRVMNERDGPRFLFQELLAPSIETQFAELLLASEDADVLITHPAAMAGPLVARHLKKKWLSSVLAPISLWSRRDPGVPPTQPHLDRLRVLGPLWGEILLQVGRRVTRSWVREVEQLVRKRGLEVAGHPLFEGQFSPLGTLALFSPHFCAPQHDWPKNTTATGFCFYDSSGHKAAVEPGEWRAWMESGSPPVVWTLGSSAVHDAGDFYWQGARECLENGRRALLLAGEGARELSQSPGDGWQGEVLALDYAPYSEVFPLASGVVHQGGAGTTAQALRAGVPQIIVPFAHDQSDNGARIQRLGVGTTVARRRVSGQSVQTLFAREPDFRRRARELGELIRGENGPVTACETLEQL